MPIAFAKTRLFSGDVMPVTFAYAAAACGNQVSASGTFVLQTGVSTLKIPLTASDCFP